MTRHRKKYMRKYQVRWLRLRRDRWMEENGPCVKCGSDQSLELDHIDPATKASHRVWSWRKSRRERELQKCQVLCHECHKAKTIREQRGENSPTAKLNADEVRAIHKAHRRGETQVSLSERFSVSRRQIGRITDGQRWAHIYAELNGGAP